ncbi:MAG: hypothetical protein QXX10_05010, partial [Desulfurococcaceae archaeon]
STNLQLIFTTMFYKILNKIFNCISTHPMVKSRYITVIRKRSFSPPAPLPILLNVSVALS